jgi:hypothetical protein
MIGLAGSIILAIWFWCLIIGGVGALVMGLFSSTSKPAKRHLSMDAGAVAVRAHWIKQRTATRDWVATRYGGARSRARPVAR